MTSPSWKIIEGDALAVLATLEAGSVDAIATDPPYGLGFMGKEWDRDVCAKWPVEALRVLKPGGHLVAFGGTRTYHRLACAVEDAGFEIRDSLMWIYGSGFPKSLDVSKAIDKAAGAERECGGASATSCPDFPNPCSGHTGNGRYSPTIHALPTLPSTDAAREWDGWGTALKPAHEPIVLARKPLIGTVAANVLEHGTGALNVDGCRVETEGHLQWKRPRNMGYHGGRDDGDVTAETNHAGRWPPNVLLTHAADCGAECCGDTCPVAELDRQSGDCATGRLEPHHRLRASENRAMSGPNQERSPRQSFGGDSGGASRFFPRFRYEAKASSGERNAGLEGMPRSSRPVQIQQSDGRQMAGLAETLPTANHHPTVKPIDLMRWLCRLITPPKGLILDPFMGSGTTGIAALREGFRFIGIEREAEYVEIARRRIEEDAPLFQRQGGKP